MPTVDGDPNVAQRTSEARFLEFAQSRDSAILERLLHEHLPQVYRIALRLLPHQADADDAVQEALVNLVRTCGRYDGSIRFAAWLGQLVRSAALDQRRARVARARHERPSATPPATATPDPPNEAEGHVDAIRKAVSELPELYRAPIELHYYAQLTQVEIANALGMKESTVAKRLIRGRERLRSKLSRGGLTLGLAALVDLLAAPSGAAQDITVSVPEAVRAATARAAAQAPSRASLAGAGKVALVAIVAITLGLWFWSGRSRGGSAPAAGATVPASPVAARAAPTSEVRDLGLPSLSWYIPDDATTADVPTVAIGTALSRDVADDLGHITGGMAAESVPWTTPWHWGRLPLSNAVRPDRTPARMLGAPVVGDQAYLIYTTPLSDARMHSSSVPTALSMTSGGWRLLVDGSRVPFADDRAKITRVRKVFAYALGRFPPGEHRLDVEARWQELPAPNSHWSQRCDVDRATLTMRGGVRAGGPPAALAALEPQGSSVDVDDKHLWQMPFYGKALELTDEQAPPEFGGLIAGDEPPRRAFRAARREYDNTVLILGPPLTTQDDMTLQSVRSDGVVVTVTVAVWQRHDSNSQLPRHRRLLPVHIARLPGVVGPMTVTLAWERFVAEEGSASYVRDDGPPIAGTYRIEGFDPVPDP